jgi:hypothetical protein
LLESLIAEHTLSALVFHILQLDANVVRIVEVQLLGIAALTRDYYSVGGGLVVNQDRAAEDRIVADITPLQI